LEIMVYRLSETNWYIKY